MAIDLLNFKSVWAKVGAGFKGGKLWGALPPYPNRHYADGREAIAEQAQMVEKQPSGAFTGKTFSQRKK